MTSANAGQFRVWGPGLTGRRRSCWGWDGVGRPHAGRRALPWLTVRVLDEPRPTPCPPSAYCAEGRKPCRWGALERSYWTVWSGAEEGEDGQHPAVLVGRLGQAEFLEDLGDVGFDGAFGDDQPGGAGPVGPALGDQPEDLSFPLAELGQGVLPAAPSHQARDDRGVDHRLP